MPIQTLEGFVKSQMTLKEERPIPDFFHSGSWDMWLLKFSQVEKGNEPNFNTPWGSALMPIQ